MYCVRLIAPSCVAFTPPQLTGEEQATALEFLDATLAKLTNRAAFATNYKPVNISMVMTQMVSAKNMNYQSELTAMRENLASDLAQFRWHRFSIAMRE